MSQQLVINIPDALNFDLRAVMQSEQPLLREAVAMALYHHDRIDIVQAMKNMSVSRRVFEDKLAEYGIPMMDGEDEFQTELDASKLYTSHRNQ